MGKRKSVSAKEVKDTLSQAQLGQGAQEVIVANLNASATALAACQGTEATELGATEATIVTLVGDGSGSMEEVADEVRRSFQESVEAMKESKQAAALTLSLIVFNQDVRVVFANTPVEEIKDSDINYFAVGQTALYDAVLDGLTGAVAYEEQLLRSGIATKVIVVVFSDGADNSSQGGALAKVKVLADELRKRENWVLAFVGFQTYEADRGTDYKVIAENMGFPALLEISLGSNTYQRRHAIRQTFRLVSKSVIRQSKTAIDPNADPNTFFAT